MKLESGFKFEPPRIDKELFWKERCDEATAQDGFMTWENHFREQCNPNLDRTEFIKRYFMGEYKTYSVEEVADMINAPDLRRAIDNQATTAEEAYIESERQRGQQDLDSVNHFLSIGRPSPILTARVLVKDDKDPFDRPKQKLLKLDGQHRAVASYIKNPNALIRALEIDLT